MNSLAIKSLTTLDITDKISPATEDDDSFGSIEISKERIDSFTKDPTIETEIDDVDKQCTVLPLPIKKENLLRIEENRVYRHKTSVSSQSWRGYVVDLKNDHFRAIITDLSGHNQDEEVEIPLKAISQDDLHLVVEGAHFDWHIGYEKYSGTTQKYSKILFRRMPRWTRNDFLKAATMKKKLLGFIAEIPK